MIVRDIFIGCVNQFTQDAQKKCKTNNARSQHLGFKSNTTLFLDYLHVKRKKYNIVLVPLYYL